MSFRTRILLTFMILWVFLLLLAGVTRKEMTRRISEEHARRVDLQVTQVEQELAAQKERIESRLEALSEEVADDNRFRLVAGDSLYSDRSYVLNYAGRAMRLLGFSVLRIQDARGRIVSSGHFRNEYDQAAPLLPRLLTGVRERAVLVRLRRAEGSLLALAGIDSVRIGEQNFTLLGGVEVDGGYLARLTRIRTWRCPWSIRGGRSPPIPTSPSGSCRPLRPIRGGPRCSLPSCTRRGRSRSRSCPTRAPRRIWGRPRS
jgi:hypothetical protein